MVQASEEEPFAEYRRNMDRPHTPEPWAIREDFEGERRVFLLISDGWNIGRLYSPLTPTTDEESLVRANARRIVACVNYLAEVDTAVLEAMKPYGVQLAQAENRLIEATALLQRMLKGRVPHAHPGDGYFWDGTGEICDPCKARVDAAAFLKGIEEWHPWTPQASR